MRYLLAQAGFVVLVAAGTLVEAQTLNAARVVEPQKAAVPEHLQTLDGVLEAIDAADEKLTTLDAFISYERFNALAGDVQTRVGTLYYERRETDADSQAEAEFPAERHFAILFDALYLDGDVAREENQLWACDGQWLVERNDEDKTYRKRRIAAPGERFDPFDIGAQGVSIPIPIGQSPQAITSRFDVKLLPWHEGLPPSPLADGIGVAGPLVQLLLTPKEPAQGEEAGAGGGQAEASSEKFSTVRLWYRVRADVGLLPVLSMAVDRAGDESLVRIEPVADGVNGERQAGRVDLSVPEGDAWDVQVTDRLAR